MITSNQENIKVHFAGQENEDFARVLHTCSGINYALFTVFPFIAGDIGLKPMKFATCTEAVLKFLCKNNRHVIMDSGLFTLMFGSHSGRRDKEFVTKWYDLIVDFVNRCDYNSTIVEVDCQKILGAEVAWEFRQRMAKDTGCRVINVFHVEDERKGLDRLIEFSDYIAISIPEFRKLRKKHYAEDVAIYIKNKKPEIDIHLLGCTDMKLIKRLNFCSSSDSTSWQGINRYGHLKVNFGRHTIGARNSSIKTEPLERRYGDDVRKILNKVKVEITDKRVDYLCKYALACELLKTQYAIYAGSQD